MSNLLLWLFTKKWQWANHSRHSLQKSDMSDSLIFWKRITLLLFHSQKTSNWLEKCVALTMLLRVFFTAFNLFIPKSKLLPSLFAPSLILKSHWSDSLLEKSQLLFCSFNHKKRAIRFKNQRANSQPWK